MKEERPGTLHEFDDMDEEITFRDGGGRGAEELSRFVVGPLEFKVVKARLEFGVSFWKGTPEALAEYRIAKREAAAAVEEEKRRVRRERDRARRQAKKAKV